MGYLRWLSLVRHVQKKYPLGKVDVVTVYSRPLSSTLWNSYPNYGDPSNESAGRCGTFFLSKLQVPVLFRSFSTALAAQECIPELTQENVQPNDGSETSGGSDAAPVIAKPQKVKKERLPAERGITLFFERMKVVEQVVDVLKQGQWGEGTEAALRKLSLTYNSQLVTQVLRIGFPYDVALGFFRWLKGQDGFQHDEYTYGVMLNSLGRGGHMKEMEELLTEIRSGGCIMTPVIISCAMHWLARVGDARSVRRYWERLRHEGVKPSLGIYTAYLDLLIRVKWFTRIPYVYERMISDQLLPSSRTYTLLIQHLSDAGRLRAAVQILEIMQKLQVVPSRVAYEFIVEGYAKAGDVEKVQEFLMQMRERFHRPSNRLMLAFKTLQEAGKLEEAAALKEEIGQEDSNEMEQPSEDNASSSEDGESILDSLMCEWRGATAPNVGFDVNAFAQALHTWSLSVEAALERENLEWQNSLVLEVLRRLRNLETSWPFFHWVRQRAGFKHDKYTCMVMIQRILKSRSPIDTTASLVDELFEVMQKDGIKSTVPMFNIMIRHYVLARDLERAEDMFSRIREFKLEPTATSFAPMIQAFARDRQGKKAMDMLNQMEESGFHPDSVTCAELITCLELAEKLPEAYELFGKISEFGRSPSALEYKAIMSAYSRAGDQKMALKLYEQMRGAGIQPTQDMFDEVSVILRKANRQYDINTIANYRKKLKFFGGRKKALQEDLLRVLDLFMRSMKPRRNNAYASAAKFIDNTLLESDDASRVDTDEADSVETVPVETLTSDAKAAAS